MSKIIQIIKYLLCIKYEYIQSKLSLAYKHRLLL